LSISGGNNPLEVRRHLERRYRRLAEARQLRPLTAIVARFNEIGGGTLGAMVSVQLFTTVIPLMIVGFSYMRGFADNASPGTLIIRELGLVHPAADHVRSAFGSSSALRSSWTFLGVAGFLIWGIPMGIMIAGIFAKAWRREQFGILGRLWRGVVWFALYLVMIGLRDRIAFGGDHHAGMRIVRFVVSLLPVWIFWSLTPALLVRDGGRGRNYLMLAGLAGVLIDGILLPIGSRLLFPPVLDGWDELGPIGVAMALLTWCGAVGTAWVITACVGAVLWERNAPSDTVIESQTEDLSTAARAPK
jgi:hypothetical protein